MSKLNKVLAGLKTARDAHDALDNSGAIGNRGSHKTVSTLLSVILDIVENMQLAEGPKPKVVKKSIK